METDSIKPYNIIRGDKRKCYKEPIKVSPADAIHQQIMLTTVSFFGKKWPISGQDRPKGFIILLPPIVLPFFSYRSMCRFARE